MSYVTESQADSPYFLWLLDEASGAVANDSGGSGRNGVINGTPTYEAAGPGGGLPEALALDATADYMDRAASGGWVDDFTVLVWVRPDTLTGNQMLVDHTNGSGLGWEIALRSGRVSFRVDSGTWRTLDEAGAVVAAAYSFIVVRRIAGTWECVIDDDLQAATGFTDTPTTQSALITVGRARGGSDGLVGRIAAVEVVPSALAAARLTARYEAVAGLGDSGVSSFALHGLGEAARFVQPALGCGTYEILIFHRGGERVFCSMNWSSLSWGRLLDETSQGSVTNLGAAGAGSECCGLLGEVEPWEHELAIYRNGEQIWIGPIVQARFGGGGVTFEARDCSAWWDKRFIHSNHDYGEGNFVDLGTLFQRYADDALAPDTSPNVCLSVAPTGVLAERNVLAASHLLAGPLLREIARAGIDWTVVARAVLAGGAIPAEPLPPLLDHHFAEEPVVILDGLAQENRAGVRGAGVGVAGDAVFADARDGDSIVEYGLLEGIVSEDQITKQPEARVAARSRLATLKDPVGTLEEGSLVPDVGIPIGSLIPGVIAPVRLAHTCRPVVQDHRLAFVRGEASASGAESIRVGFIPPGDEASAAASSEEEGGPPPSDLPPPPGNYGPILWLRLGEASGDLLDYSGYSHHATLSVGTEGTATRDEPSLAPPDDGSLLMDAAHTYPWETQWPDVQDQPSYFLPGDAPFWPWTTGTPWTMLFVLEMTGHETLIDRIVNMGLIGALAPAGGAARTGWALRWEGRSGASGPYGKLRFGKPGGSELATDYLGDIVGVVAITYSGSPDFEGAIYLNGEVVASGALTLETAIAAGALTVGKVDMNLQFSGGMTWAMGRWDEMLAWNRVLTAEEIAEHTTFLDTTPPVEDPPPADSANWEVARRIGPSGGTFPVESGAWTPVPFTTGQLWRQTAVSAPAIVADDRGFFTDVDLEELKIPFTERYFRVGGRVLLESPKVDPTTSRRGCRLFDKTTGTVLCSWVQLADIADEFSFPGVNTFGPCGMYDYTTDGSVLYAALEAGHVLELQVWQNTGTTIQMRFGVPPTTSLYGAAGPGAFAHLTVARYY